jgi:hypothetical protein
MVNVTNRANVAMRLRTFKLLFGHPVSTSVGRASARHQTGGWLLKKTALFKSEVLSQGCQTAPEESSI